jgi:hypothetical protein
MIINTEMYPHVMEAVHFVQSDSGNDLAIPVLDVPDRWKPFLPDIEEAVSALSRRERAPEEEPLPPHVKPSELLDSEFSSFCIGEGMVMEKIANRSMELLLALVFLTDYFEGWTYTDELTSSPKNKMHQKRIEYLDSLEREGTITFEQRLERDDNRLQIN